MRKAIYFTLAGLFLCGSFSACAQPVVDPSTPVHTAKTWDYNRPTNITYDCLGGDGNVMPILGFWSAPSDATFNGQFFPDIRNDDYFNAVAESGINLMVQASFDDAKANDAVVESTLNYCDKYNIGYYVTDKRLFDTDMLCNKTELLQRTEEYAKHKSFAGYYIKDEPYPSVLEKDESGKDFYVNGEEGMINRALKGFYEVINELNINAHPYVTMFPYEIRQFNPTPSMQYTRYIREIYKSTEAVAMMYDLYPLREIGFSYEAFYTQLSFVRTEARDMKKDWIPYVSVSDEDNPGQTPDIFYYVMPTEGELSWQVNQYLAFGAKGISYFPMNSPLSFYPEVLQGDTVGMFDWAGNKTEVYYYVREVNKQLHAIDQYLMNATNHGVIFHGEIEGKEYLKNNEIIAGGSFRELRSISGDNATVGCFDYYGKTCLYVVNGSMEEDAALTLRFDNRYGYTLIQRGTTANVKGSKINLSLAAGEAALVVLK